MTNRALNILSISDVQEPVLYSPRVKTLMQDIDVIIDCGDLPYYYVEYIHNALDKPLYFVRGNHSKIVEIHGDENISAPRGGIDLHRRLIRLGGLLLGGVEGSLRYRPGPFQYSQGDMWLNVFALVPGMLANRLRFGRFLDIFVTHASPWEIHDQPDLPHQGIKAFLWLDRVFQPAYHLHGHIHVYRPDTITETFLGQTCIINTFGYRVTQIEKRHDPQRSESTQRQNQDL